jgi:hypothetical protein
LSEWIDCGLTGTCDDTLTAKDEPPRIVPLAKTTCIVSVVSHRVTCITINKSSG